MLKEVAVKPVVDGIENRNALLPDIYIPCEVCQGNAITEKPGCHYKGSQFQTF